MLSATTVAIRRFLPLLAEAAKPEARMMSPTLNPSAMNDPVERLSVRVDPLIAMSVLAPVVAAVANALRNAPSNRAV